MTDFRDLIQEMIESASECTQEEYDATVPVSLSGCYFEASWAVKRMKRSLAHLASWRFNARQLQGRYDLVFSRLQDIFDGTEVKWIR